MSFLRGVCMHEREIVSNKQVKLEIELIINKKLFDNEIINREVYELVAEDLLKNINREVEKA